MEFLVDTGMELARNIVFKIVDICQDEASKRVGATGYTGQTMRNWLQPQMEKLEEEIKDLSEGTYRTALSHLHHAFVILKERYESLEREPQNFRNLENQEPRVGDEVTRVPWKNDDQGLPQVAVTLINMAYDKAYNSFNYTTNLSIAKRITSMQVAILCIGLHHVTEPRVVFARWEKCYADVLRDQAIVKSLEKNLEGTQGILRFFYSLKAKDLDTFLVFARDILCQTSRIAARDEVDKATIKNFIEKVVYPREFSSNTQKIWSEKLNWLDYVNSCTFREELRLKEAGAAFDACAALPDGGVVFAMGNDALIQYNRDFVKTNFKPGSYYSLTYDPNRHCLWGFSKRRNTLVRIDIDSLEDTGQHIAAPVSPGNMRVARWHIAVTSKGWLVIAAQFLRESDARGAKPYLYLKKTDNPDEPWCYIKIECSIKSQASKVTDISVYDQGHGGELATLLIALAFESSLHLLTAKIDNTSSFVTEAIHIAPDLAKDRTCCAFDTEGLLIAASRRKCLLIYDTKQNKVVKQAPAARCSGAWVAVGQRAIWVATLHGDIYQYEYFVF